MTLREFAGDLLPDAILARASKASFNDAFWSEHAQRFADQWSGEGVDPELVDVDKLHALWGSDERKVLTFPLLQQAWLAENVSKKRVVPVAPTRHTQPRL